MPAALAALSGSAISHGGVIGVCSPTVAVEGRPVARITDPGVCTEHGPVVVLTGSLVNFADGLGIARVGDSMSCGATIVDGALTVMVE